VGTYVMLTTLGPDGWATVRENPERIRQVTHEVESMGLKVIAQYALMGQWDFLNVIEAPDEATLAKAAISLAARGTMRTPPGVSGRTGATRSHPPHRATALLLPDFVADEQRRQDRAVRLATNPVAGVGFVRFGDDGVDLEASSPAPVEPGPNLNASSWLHASMVTSIKWLGKRAAVTSL